MISASNNPRSEPVVSVYVRLHNGNGSLLLLEQNASLGQLLTAVRQTELQLPHSFTLTKGGKTLEEQQMTLKTAGIEDSNIVHIVNQDSSFSETPQIHVNIYYQGTRMVINTSKEDVVSDLKLALFRLTTLKPRQQWLVFRGEKLEDQKKLHEYGIFQDSLVSLYPMRKRQVAKTFRDLQEFSQKSPLTTSTQFTKNETIPACIEPFGLHQIIKNPAAQAGIREDEVFEFKIGEKSEDQTVSTPELIPEGGRKQREYPTYTRFLREEAIE